MYAIRSYYGFDLARTAGETVGQHLVAVLRDQDVVIILDSITRLARAYNTIQGGSGRTMSGGLERATGRTDHWRRSSDC